MGLQHEKQRVLQFVGTERARLSPLVTRLSRERAHARSFVSLVEQLFTVLDSELPRCLERIEQTVAPVSVEVASRRMNDVFTGVQGVINFLSTIGDSQEQIPRELEVTISWFFERAKGLAEAPPYCLGIHQSLATLEFRVFLDSLFNPPTPGRRNGFPELTDAFSAKPFCFILIPATMATPEAAIDWPLVFHECVHALETVAALIPVEYPGLAADKLLLKYWARHGNTTAQESLWAEELLCDHLATYLAGPGFAWRFLRRYFSILGVSYRSLSHPPVNVRVQRLIEVTRAAGFGDHAREMERSLQELLKELSVVPPVALPGALSSADRVSRVASAKLQPFDQAVFERTLNKRCGGNLAGLRGDLESRRPVVVDPACLFTIAAFRSSCEEPGICTLLADFIRLDAIEAEFHHRGLRG